MVSRVIVGASTAALATASVTIVNTRLRGEARAKWNGLHIAAAMIASIIMQPIVGYIAKFGWQAPFALYALSLPLTLVALFDPDATRLPAQPPKVRVAVGNIFVWFPFRYAALAVVIGSIGFLLTIYSPFLLSKRVDPSPTTISLVLMIHSAIAAVASLLFGNASKRFTINGAFVFSLVMFAIGAYSAATLPGAAGVIFGILVSGVGRAWFIPCLMTGAAERVEQSHQGRVAGVIRAGYDIGAPLCIVLVEPLTKRFGPEGAVMTAFIVTCILISLLAWEMLSARVSPFKKHPVG
jgi:MFS family permease